MKVYMGIRGADGIARVQVAEPDKPGRLLAPRTAVASGPGMCGPPQAGSLRRGDTYGRTS
jgi:hypothetical protein